MAPPQNHRWGLWDFSDLRDGRLHSLDLKPGSTREAKCLHAYGLPSPKVRYLFWPVGDPQDVRDSPVISLGQRSTDCWPDISANGLDLLIRFHLKPKFPRQSTVSLSAGQEVGLKRTTFGPFSVDPFHLRKVPNASKCSSVILFYHIFMIPCWFSPTPS